MRSNAELVTDMTLESSSDADETTPQTITVTIPPITTQPGHGVKLTKDGLSFLITRLVHSDNGPQTDEELAAAVEKEMAEAKPLAETVAGFSEFVEDPESNADFIDALTKLPDSSPGKWAALFFVWGAGLFGGDTPPDGIFRQAAIWQVAKFRTMLLFTREIQDLAWRGYANYGVDVVERALTAWGESDKNESEEHWQQFLQNQPYLINLIFPGPVAVHQGKAYLGGKKVDNTGGQIVDFLLEHSISGNAALLEIKRPGTNLLTRTAYRGSEIYSPSNELVGSVSQILNYRDTLLTQNNSKLDVVIPSCVVLVGDYERELDTEGKRRSFELYRRSLNGVSIVTYDELFDRLQNILDVLRGE